LVEPPENTQLHSRGKTECMGCWGDLGVVAHGGGGDGGARGSRGWWLVARKCCGKAGRKNATVGEPQRKS